MLYVPLHSSLLVSLVTYLHFLSQYRAVDAPWYTLGHGIVLIYIVIGFVAAITNFLLLKRENARRDRGERDEIITGVNDSESNAKRLEKNGRFETVEDAKREKGDEWSGYRYTL